MGFNMCNKLGLKKYSQIAAVKIRILRNSDIKTKKARVKEIRKKRHLDNNSDYLGSVSYYCHRLSRLKRDRTPHHVKLESYLDRVHADDHRRYVWDNESLYIVVN